MALAWTAKVSEHLGISSQLVLRLVLVIAKVVLLSSQPFPFNKVLHRLSCLHVSKTHPTIALAYRELLTQNCRIRFLAATFMRTA